MSFVHATRGINICIRMQRNMKVLILAAIVVFAMAWWLDFSRTEIMILALTVINILAAEMINTAIESVVDLISPEYHLLAKTAKDIAAGAVLLLSIASVFIGFMLFWNKL